MADDDGATSVTTVAGTTTTGTGGAGTATASAGVTTSGNGGGPPAGCVPWICDCNDGTRLVSPVADAACDGTQACEAACAGYQGLDEAEEALGCSSDETCADEPQPCNCSGGTITVAKGKTCDLSLGICLSPVSVAIAKCEAQCAALNKDIRSCYPIEEVCPTVACPCSGGWSEFTHSSCSNTGECFSGPNDCAGTCGDGN